MIESSFVAFNGEGPDLPDLLTADETAGYLRCCLRTLRRLETGGYLTPVRVGRRTLRYRRDDVRRLIGHALSKRIEGSMQGQSGKN